MDVMGERLVTVTAGPERSESPSAGKKIKLNSKQENPTECRGAPFKQKKHLKTNPPSNTFIKGEEFLVKLELSFFTGLAGVFSSGHKKTSIGPFVLVR